MSSNDSLENAAYVQRVHPDHVDDYVAAHESVPDGVTEAMARAGVETFRLFLSGDIAVCYLEAPDIQAYIDEVANDPEVVEWERTVAAFKTDSVDVDAAQSDQIPFMDEIWTLTGSDKQWDT